MAQNFGALMVVVAYATPNQAVIRFIIFYIFLFRKVAQKTAASLNFLAGMLTVEVQNGERLVTLEDSRAK